MEARCDAKQDQLKYEVGELKISTSELMMSASHHKDDTTDDLANVKEEIAALRTNLQDSLYEHLPESQTEMNCLPHLWNMQSYSCTGI